VSNATATIGQLSSQLASSLASSPFERTTSIIAIAALSNVTTTPGGRRGNATEVLLGRLTAQLFSLPDVYTTDLLTLTAAATAAAALASITGHTPLKLDARYTALEALNRYGFCPSCLHCPRDASDEIISFEYMTWLGSCCCAERLCV
jgi:hypothetical protein